MVFAPEEEENTDWKKKKYRKTEGLLFFNM